VPAGRATRLVYANGEVTGGCCPSPAASPWWRGRAARGRAAPDRGPAALRVSGWRAGDEPVPPARTRRSTVLHIVGASGPSDIAVVGTPLPLWS